jgi:hypothetical protein
VATIVGFATAMMFRYSGIEETRWGFRSFFEVLWFCSAIDEGKELLDVVDLWDETMELDWFAMLTPSRTSGFSCSQAKPPLLTRVCCKNTVGTPT